MSPQPRQPRKRYGWNGVRKITVGSKVRYKRDMNVEDLDEDYTLSGPDIVMPNGEFYGEIITGPDNDESSGPLWEVIWIGVTWPDGTPLDSWWTYEELMEAV